MQTIFDTTGWPMSYRIFFYAVVFFMLFGIGVPTIYAMLFGAPWVPTPMRAVRRMIKESGLKSGKKVYELGCGDGRLILNATKINGVVGVGYEISPLIYIVAWLKNAFTGFKAKISFRSFWGADLSDADVIYLYLLPMCAKKLVEKFKKELDKDTLIISYAFKLDGLTLIKRIERDREKNICPILIYKI